MDKDTNFPEAIRQFKESHASRRGLLTSAYHELEAELHKQSEQIHLLQQAKGSAIPQLDYAQVDSSSVSADEIDEIHKRGCVLVRGVYDEAEVVRWNEILGEYIDSNDYYTKSKEKAGMDTYFGDLASGKPQIFGLYWSKPQIWARQGEAMAKTKRFLNSLWDINEPGGQVFDPNVEYSYADRTRRREPGDQTLGLSPHMDSGSVERWLDPAYQRIYASVFEGNWSNHKPFNAAGRTDTKEYPSPAVCSMFRTFQGWTALTPQGPSDGTLSLAPTTHAIGYMLLRALQEDVPADELCGAQPGKALGVSEQWHKPLLDCMVSIPQMQPGDTIWWHTDTVHSVGDHHQGKEYANVIYIGATPGCAKNQAYLKGQAAAFLAGKSAPDFAAEDYEVDFKGRATLEDLTDIGKAQLGLS